MKKLILISAITIVVTGCNSKTNVVNKSNDSIEYAVYTGTPLDYVEDCEPVYIPLDMDGINVPGDTCITDSNGFLIPILMRDAETKQPVMAAGYHKVKIDERLDYNKSFKK